MTSPDTAGIKISEGRPGGAISVSSQKLSTSQTFPDATARVPPEDKREQPIELVAVINSFNRRELLQQAVTSLALALRNISFGSAIVVFDAGSTDGSIEFVEEWRAQNTADNLVLVLAGDDRTSFSEGVNIGCATALERFPDSRWLLLYETDNCLSCLGANQ